MGQTIALVDDDRNILTSVKMALEAEGFNVWTYKDGEEAFAGLSADLPDLVVLDIKMPRMDGIEVLGKLREITSIPIIFLTSKDDEVDEVIGLRMGADDYITKPFSQRLLIERIRALLRRHSLQDTSLHSEPKSSSSKKMSRGDLEMDDDRHICTWKGRKVDLTVTEYLILKSLVERPGVVRSREQLMNLAYGDNIYVDDRTIDSHIKRLRKKFRAIDDEFSQIETLYGVGYKYKES